MPISPPRLRLALERLDKGHGYEFEEYANGFLAPEFPDLRPVGGMHDGGRDAFLYVSGTQPTTFVQHSVRADWSTKITTTIQDLRKNGHTVRELVYATNRAIQADADAIRARLRADGVSLDVRDREYFVAHCNTTDGRAAISEALAQRIVDPFLQQRDVLPIVSGTLTREEERIAATFLRLEVATRTPEKNLTKLSFDALVTFALRDADPEHLHTLETIAGRISALTPAHAASRVRELTKAAIGRLVESRLVKHHTKEDAYTLAHKMRDQLTERVEKLLVEESILNIQVCERVREVARRLGIDYDFVTDSVSRDVITLLDHLLCEQGRLAALALAERGNFYMRRESISDYLETLLKKKRDFVSLHELSDERFIDLVPAVVEDLLRKPTRELLSRMGTAANAYCLLFALQQTADVQKALLKLLGNASVLVDTAILVPALAEHLAPRDEQRVSNVLRSASKVGFNLIVGDDVLNELETHLDRMKIVFANRGDMMRRKWDAGQMPPGENPIIEAYLQFQPGGAGGFAEYIDLFMGREDRKTDLIEYLKYQFGIRYDELESERRAIDSGEEGELFAHWRKIKKRRPWVDEAAFERLVFHDVRAFLLLLHLRRKERPNETLGHRWWWLTSDGAARRVDRDKRRETKQVGVCMSLDFFLRYVSLMPKASGADRDTVELLPASIEFASLGLVPPEVRDQAELFYESHADQPEYLRRRRLRELVHQAYMSDDDGRLSDEAPIEAG